MSESVLIFTFSPIQSFIEEARRASDLYMGSTILVQLAQASAQSLRDQGASLVYPSNLEGDVPNRIVAIVPDGIDAGQVARTAGEELKNKWMGLSGLARKRFLSRSPNLQTDQLWEQIWNKQVSSVWEIYWACAEMNNRTYAEAYALADRTLAGVKRTRVFDAVEEAGVKDTLSGSRSALRTNQMDAPEYWAEAARHTTAAILRPDGRERLDTRGLVKRFGGTTIDLNLPAFPSTSSLASSVFLLRAKELAPSALMAYQKSVEGALRKSLFRVNDDPLWPYDGDLLYIDFLQIASITKTYREPGLREADLKEMREKLAALYKAVGKQPSTYYTILRMDGDNMGAAISNCLSHSKPRDAHLELSQRLHQFSEEARKQVESEEAQGRMIYNGGDDLLAFLPLDTAVLTAARLANLFQSIVKDTSVSAGLVVFHHTSPLDHAVSLSSDAEKEAKKMDHKAALAARVVKRGGESLDMVSHWLDLSGGGTPARRFQQWVDIFQKDQISARFAYTLEEQMRTGSLIEDSTARRLLVERLLNRHQNESGLDLEQCAADLVAWAHAIQPDRAPGMSVVSAWLRLALFTVKGGAI